MQWDDVVDVVVVGSGLAALAAPLAASAQGLRALVLEKGDQVGGATTYSYGGLWIGNNPLARAEGYADSRAETVAYLKYLGAGLEIDDNLQAFADGAPVTLEFFRQRGIPFQLAHGVPDHYYDMAPGSKADGRMLEVPLISGYALGDWRTRVAVPPIVPMGATFEEAIRWGGHGNFRNWDRDLLAERAKEDLRGFGAGLAAHFLRALLERGVPLRLATPAERLLVEDGAVVGVLARQGERTLRLQARRGVILAAGGYESNADLARRYEGFLEWGSVYPKTLTGDGLVMAAEIGATVHVIPTNLAMFLGYQVPAERAGAEPAFRSASNRELASPYTLVVNAHGERFADESYFQAMLSAIRHFDVWRHQPANLPCYLVFDQEYADRYSFAGAPAGSAIPAWVPRAETVGDLAAALGLDPARLEATVDRFNGFARHGEDPDFQRGRAPWSNYYTGDLTHQPNPNLGPVERAPFYGVRLLPSGASSAGLLTTRHGQVVHLRGHPIAGLYATGNTAACVDYGAGYQAGLSLARGLTFSYLAVAHLLGAAS